MEPIGFKITINFILLLIVFILSLCETIIVSLKTEKIDTEINQGNYYFINIKKFLCNPDLFKNTFRWAKLLCIIISSIIFYNNFLHRVLYDNANIFASLFRSVLFLLYFVLTLVVTIYIPKQLAIKYNSKLSSIAIALCNILYVFLLPISKVIELSSAILNKIFHVNIHQKESYTEEEIRMMMDISVEKGTIQDEEKQMIDNIFEFDNITAEDVMTHRTDVVAIDINNSNEEIIDIIKSSGFSRFPVYDDEIDNIIGTLSSRKFLLNLHAYPQMPLRDILYAPYIVPVSIQADILFKRMQKTKNHIAFTVDEYGGFNGLVTMEDLLEEIVGNIYDENDKHVESEIIKINKNLWKVVGSVELEEINNSLGINIPLSDDYDTLNGLVIDTLSYIPEDGSKFEVDIYDMHVKVLSFKDKRIESALLSKINSNQSKIQ